MTQAEMEEMARLHRRAVITQDPRDWSEWSYRFVYYWGTRFERVDQALDLSIWARPETVRTDTADHARWSWLSGHLGQLKDKRPLGRPRKLI